MTIKSLFAISFLPILIALTGCGGSSSSSYDPNSQTNVALANTSNFNYAQVSIVNSAGKETLFIDSINCPSGSTSCYVNLNMALNAGDSLLFKNENGVMVAAITASESSSGYTALSPSAMSTGFYLVNRLSSELLAESGKDWDDVNQRTLNFFSNYDSPDGSADPYEEVGDYYASRITRTAASERAFLDTFKSRLLEWEVVDPTVFPGTQTAAANFISKFKTLFANKSFTLIASAYAQDSPCNGALKTFLTIAGAIGKVIPVVGEGIAGAGKLGESYCKGSGADYKAVLSQLNDLQNSINQVSKTIATLSTFIFEAQVNNKIDEFRILATDARNSDKDYREFLINNKSTSLEQFFTNAGGWQAGLTKGGAALDKILSSPHNANGTGMYTRITQSTGLANFDSYLSALSNRCRQLTVSSNDNFLITRQRCNNAILANSGNLVAVQTIVLPIFKDIYATLNKYKADAANTYLIPADFTSYASAYNDARNKFTAQQVAMISAYAAATGTTISSEGGGFFDAFAGLNTTLVGSLAVRQCNQSEEPGRRNSPAIVGWFATDSTADGKNNFIETACRIPSTNQRISARYYYNNNNDGVNGPRLYDVKNILGVPVAAAYVSSSDTWPLDKSLANRSSETYGYGDSRNVFVEFPSARAIGKFANGDLVSPSITPVANLYTFPQEALYAIVPSGGKYFHVVRAWLYTVQGGGQLVGSIDCLAAPCRVDAGGEWIIFEDDNKTLDMRDTLRIKDGRKVLRIGPVGQ
jgi:hypothetical protein